MKNYNTVTLSGEIINKALEFGASLAGIVNIEELKSSPSHMISGKMAEFGGVGTKRVEGRRAGEVLWPENAHSAVVIALEHPRKKPPLDWWVKGLNGGTEGNIELISTIAKLAEWMERDRDIHCTRLAYHIEKGSVYMKDAAVLGGLGCIGKNNILVTPQFGPRVRLRVMLMDADLPSTGKQDFDPCSDCKEYCKKVCPQSAFEKQIYSPEEFGQRELPSRTGVYNRLQCNIQMERDVASGKDVQIRASGKIGHEVRYCRLCELSCPVGGPS